MRKGSALLMALWTIMVLSVIVVSFSFEAHLQGGINVYVQNKNRVKRLVESGRILGEVIILGYKDAKQWTEDEDEKELLEDDRWYKEKQDLKYKSKCFVGPILLDEEDSSSGTVEVEISVSEKSTGGGININKLFSEDSNWMVRWQIILDRLGISREEDFRTKDGKTINLQKYIMGCWNDYRDEDDNCTQIDGVDSGAESKEYEEWYEENEDAVAEQDRFGPANAEITDLKELSRVLCFREYPALLTGGVINPYEDEKNQINVKGLLSMNIFSVSGDGKINVNDCTVDQLLTVPGIYIEDEVDEDDKSESIETAEAIVKCRSIMPQEYDVPEDGRTEWAYGEFTSDWWSDMQQRISDEFDVEIDQSAQQYLKASPDDSTVFSMKITGRIMDMAYSAECECYIKDSKIRYVSWKE
jgi:hypothetical protein